MIFRTAGIKVQVTHLQRLRYCFFLLKPGEEPDAALGVFGQRLTF